LSRKNIIENEAVNQLIKGATWKRSTIDIRKRTIMNFIKKQIDKKTKEQWLIAWNESIKKENQYQKHTARMNLSYRSLKKLWKIDRLTFSTFFFFLFIKCMQSMTMKLSRRCMYAKLHVIWSKSLLYIFLLINHIDSLCIQALSLNSRHRTFVFLCFFALFTFYSFVFNSHFLVAIQVFFKYSSVAILSILMMNSVNIVSVFSSWAFFLSFICSAL